MADATPGLRRLRPEDCGLIVAQQSWIVDRAVVVNLPPAAVDQYEYPCRPDREVYDDLAASKLAALSADRVEDVRVFVNRIVRELDMNSRRSVEEPFVDASYRLPAARDTAKWVGHDRLGGQQPARRYPVEVAPIERAIEVVQGA